MTFFLTALSKFKVFIACNYAKNHPSLIAFNFDGDLKENLKISRKNAFHSLINYPFVEKS